MALSHPDLTPLSSEIIRCAIVVHRDLGPSLLEAIYEECLELELGDVGLKVESQAAVPVIYKGRQLKACYRPDLIVDRKIIVEIKSVEKLIPVHSSQILTYMRLTGIRVGLLFNFNSAVLTQAMKRLSL
jgi:GxxExxY protein